MQTVGRAEAAQFAINLLIRFPPRGYLALEVKQSLYYLISPGSSGIRNTVILILLYISNNSINYNHSVLLICE